MTNSVRTRFAPSPTGFVHVGSMYAALFSYAYAKRHGGEFIVRLEDTDRTRLVEGAEEALFDGLEWIGLMPDESVVHEGDVGPYRQSERLDLYRKYAEELIAAGHAYYAFDTPEEIAEMRKEQQARGEAPRYDRRALKLSEEDVRERLDAGEPHVVRLKVPAGRTVTFTDAIRGEISFESDLIDDQILMKSDGFPTYHLAVVVDDHLMGITHVVRAEEWISSTPKHVLLYEAFGWEFPVHAHLPIIRNPDKSKMSKRNGHQAELGGKHAQRAHADARWYRKNGYLPEAMLNYLALLGWSHPEEDREVFSLEEFIKEVSFERVKTSAPVFDLEKLTWLNGSYLRDLSMKDLADLVLAQEEYLLENAEEGSNRLDLSLLTDTTYFHSVLTLEQERLHTLNDFTEKAAFFFQEELNYSQEILIQKKRDAEGTVKVLEKSIEIVEGVGEWKEETLEEAFEQLLEAFPDWKKRELFMTLRGVLSGQTATPPLFDTMEVLGRERVKTRLASATSFLSS